MFNTFTAQRTSLINQIRGLLQEYGVVLGAQIARLRRELPEVLEDGSSVSDPSARLLRRTRGNIGIT